VPFTANNAGDLIRHCATLKPKLYAVVSRPFDNRWLRETVPEVCH
jgi:hypothetical protein